MQPCRLLRTLAGRAWYGLTLGLALLASAGGMPAAHAQTPPNAAPNLGPNVVVFTPGMSVSQIQATVNALANQQVSNQFGTQRYALLFEPGTYGSAATPLNFQVGYYTTVAGLGRSPGDVVINGSINVYNQCDSSGACNALDNFWRSLSNLTINVSNPASGCYAGEFWAVSQAAPMRRVQVNGNTTLMDYCTAPSDASGGFIADSRFSGGTFTSGSQQQWLTRNSVLDGWSNGVWNQVFSGVTGAPAPCFPAQTSCGGPYTTLPTSPVTREAPYLYTDAGGNALVFVPGVQRNSSGISWGNGPTAGRSIPLSQFFVATPSDGAARISLALAEGKNLLLTPGVYDLQDTILVSRPDTVVLGLGMATLVPQNGLPALASLDGRGVLVAGVIVDAGPKRSPVLLQLGTALANIVDPFLGSNTANDPSALFDVFFRIGGAQAGSAGTALVVDADNALIDNVWAWRADHGAGVGWTVNTADTGLTVNGNNVVAYGLAVEHFQKYEVIWNGQNGTDIFFQNEMPYDPPSQAAWTEAPGVDGWAAFKVADGVRSFHGYGMGSYSNFDLGVDILAANAFEAPSTLPAGSLTDLLTVFLNPASSGGILNVVDNTGGASTGANPDVPVTVTSYP